MAYFLLRNRNIPYEGSLRTLRKTLGDIGFTYVRRRGHRYLFEQPHITAKKREFLRQFMTDDVQGRPRIYLDETWLFQYGSSLTREWQNDDKQSCSVQKLPGGKRFIIGHAGGSDGFVPNGALMFASKQKPQPGDDYHGDMNAGIFNTWFTTKILPNIPENAVIIMDNAPYHSVHVS